MEDSARWVDARMVSISCIVHYSRSFQTNNYILLNLSLGSWGFANHKLEICFMTIFADSIELRVCLEIFNISYCWWLGGCWVSFWIHWMLQQAGAVCSTFYFSGNLNKLSQEILAFVFLMVRHQYYITLMWKNLFKFKIILHRKYLRLLSDFKPGYIPFHVKFDKEVASFDNKFWICDIW